MFPLFRYIPVPLVAKCRHRAAENGSVIFPTSGETLESTAPRPAEKVLQADYLASTRNCSASLIKHRMLPLFGFLTSYQELSLPVFSVVKVLTIVVLLWFS